MSVSAVSLPPSRPGAREIGAASGLAERLPRLLLEARRVSASLAYGLHGRRKAGTGESFWQFRPFTSGGSAQRIDWRRSARDGRLYVREREWEAAHTIWLWVDRSVSMNFISSLSQTSKIDRALVLGLALAETLNETGARIGIPGRVAPRASRRIMHNLAQDWCADQEGSPILHLLPRQDEALLIGDFLSPLPDWTHRIEALSASGARGHCLMVLDPTEETFPFSGEALLQDPESGASLKVGDAARWGELYRKRLIQHREGLREILRRRRWSLSLHRTDRPASEAALAILRLIAHHPRRLGG